MLFLHSKFQYIKQDYASKIPPDGKLFPLQSFLAPHDEHTYWRKN